MKTKTSSFLIALALVLGLSSVPAVAQPIDLSEMQFSYHPIPEGLVWRASFPVPKNPYLTLEFFRDGEVIWVIEGAQGALDVEAQTGERFQRGKDDFISLAVTAFNKIGTHGVWVRACDNNSGACVRTPRSPMRVEPWIFSTNPCQSGPDSIRLTLFAQYFSALPGLQSIKASIGGIDYQTTARQEDSYTIIQLILPRAVWDTLQGEDLVVRSSRPLKLTRRMFASEWEGHLSFCQ